MERVELGQTAKDKISGVKGVVVIRSEFLSGAPRVCIQPGADKDGSPREPLEFDENQLEVVGKKKVIDVKPNAPRVSLGAEGTDRVTGFKGIITGRAIYVNGCSRVYIQPKVDKEGKKPKGEWIDEEMVESKSKSVIEGTSDDHTVKAAKETKPKKHGGPGIGMPTTNSALRSRQ